MKELVIDGANLRSADDFYDAFFRVVGAPAWHGRNFNALIDSIGTGQINAIEVPYRIVIENYSDIGSGATKIVSDFVLLIKNIAAKGCLVEIQTQI